MPARLLFGGGYEKANPVLLEPIMDIEVVVPEEFMGQIIGDLAAVGQK